ncbi:MAG TPA: hypothetical protein VNN62_08345 [Methylomirabilota bacterium]|jgi:hypothetical protein|nr:hypothetical protein [Methylomirabilota bacterium]
MKFNSQATVKRRSEETPRRPAPVSIHALQQQYETATASLTLHFLKIDSWLCDYEPDLWRQIRHEDDELFRLRQLGVSESRYQAKLDEFLALCELAERRYYDAQPRELRLPPLQEGERVAIYFSLADGSLQRVHRFDE